MSDHKLNLFLNRETSWIEFNRRVLEEAQDPKNPLLERLRFFCIFQSNLDEFFMVRVASLQHLTQQGDNNPDPSGLTPFQQRVLRAVARVPRGKVATYAEIARRIDRPRAARGVFGEDRTVHTAYP